MFKRKSDGDSSAAAGCTFKGYSPALLLNNVLRRVEPNSVTLPLGGEEWLKDVGAGCFVHPDTGVGDCELNARVMAGWLSEGL